VLADGPTAVGDADREAAEGLAADGLAILHGGRLLPPV
jgi:hypothetical protein